MTVSLEELSLRDGLVVCPQCLNAYQAVEAGTLPAVTAQPNQTQQPSKHFCPHCGQDIGQDISHGINYCPYCGGSLRHEPSGLQQTKQPSNDSRPDTNHHRPRTSQRHAGKSTNNHTSHSNESPQGFDWKPMIPSYRLVRQRENEPASIGFQAFAIAVILALLALLAFIIYHAMRL